MTFPVSISDIAERVLPPPRRSPGLPWWLRFFALTAAAGLALVAAKAYGLLGPR